MFNKYGEPDHDYIGKYCQLWQVRDEFSWFPVGTFLVNVDFQAKLRTAFAALEKAGVHTEIKTYDGCYNDRTVRGSASTSLHAWAAAIDFNAACDGMVTNPTPAQRQGTWTPLFIQVMKGAGIYYGGDFIHRADPMHWALLDG